MDTKITDEMIDYIGILSKLDLPEEEKEQVKTDMEQILQYMNKLNELDTEGVLETTNSISLYNVMREDEITNNDDSERMLSHAPQRKEGYYVVPKTID